MREIRPGYWQLRVSLGRDPITQKSKYRTRGLRATKREASRALARLVADVINDRAEPSAETVGALLEQWLTHIEAEGRSPTTMRGYRSLRDQLPAGFLRLPLKKVTTKTLDDLYRHLAEKPGRGPSSVKHIHAMLRAAFHQAMRWDLLDRNPAILASPPRVPTTPVEPPTVADVLAVIDAARQSRRPENGVVFQVLAATGCRRSEACGLRWTDLDLGAGTVTIRRAIVQAGAQTHEKTTKGHQQRTVRLDTSTLQALGDHRAATEQRALDFETILTDGAYVFSDEPDASMCWQPDRLSRAWRRLADKVGTDARLEDLRHLQASLLLDAGESITTVAARLGHRDTATTLRTYSHLMPGADQRAADIVGTAFANANTPESDVEEAKN